MLVGQPKCVRQKQTSKTSSHLQQGHEPAATFFIKHLRYRQVFKRAKQISNDHTHFVNMSFYHLRNILEFQCVGQTGDVFHLFQYLLVLAM